MAEARLISPVLFNQRVQCAGVRSVNTALLTLGRVGSMTAPLANPGVRRKSPKPVRRREARPCRLACGPKAFKIGIRPTRCDSLCPRLRSEACVQLADGLWVWFLIEAIDHSVPSGTSWNLATSTNPRSVILSSGMTDRARKLTVMKGAVIETPMPASRRSIDRSRS